MVSCSGYGNEVRDFCLFVSWMSDKSLLLQLLVLQYNPRNMTVEHTNESLASLRYLFHAHLCFPKDTVNSSDGIAWNVGVFSERCF